MPIILVVDDVEVDRLLIGGILGTDARLEVQYAKNGKQALAAMEAELPDLVVTDLQMPELDGLGLVTAVRAKYRRVPVILTTGTGSEQIAVKALRAGAASYVPKQNVARELLTTVRNVLAVSAQQQSKSMVMECLAESQCEFELENDVRLIRPLVQHLQTCVALTESCDETDRIRIGVALEEAFSNALYHGNLEVSSELRGVDDQAFFALVHERAGQSPYQDRRLHVEMNISEEEIRFVIRDEGPGFDHTKLPDPTDEEHLLLESGRGILLMRSFMDEVSFNDSGNEVTLVKRLHNHVSA